MTAEQTPEHVVSYGTYVRVWLALVCLTGLLVVAGRLFHDTLSVPALLTITPLKAGLVFYFFMHLRYERTYIRGMVFVALATLIVFLSVLFLDLSFR
jgi:cytochrome c oxidase subunit IV